MALEISACARRPALQPAAEPWSPSLDGRLGPARRVTWHHDREPRWVMEPAALLRRVRRELSRVSPGTASLRRWTTFCEVEPLL